jgi:hypothetical protein
MRLICELWRACKMPYVVSADLRLFKSPIFQADRGSDRTKVQGPTARKSFGGYLPFSPLFALYFAQIVLLNC